MKESIAYLDSRRTGVQRPVVMWVVDTITVVPWVRDLVILLDVNDEAMSKKNPKNCDGVGI
jgi:hypothetical protein